MLGRGAVLQNRATDRQRPQVTGFDESVLSERPAQTVIPEQEFGRRSEIAAGLALIQVAVGAAGFSRRVDLKGERTYGSQS